MDVPHTLALGLVLVTGVGVWRRRRLDGKLRALEADLAAGRGVDRALRAVLGWPSPSFHAAVGLLIAYRHARDAERLLRVRPPSAGHEARHTMQLCDALLQRGNVAAARELVDSVAGLTPNGRELRTYLDALVRIAAGEADVVAARLTPEPEAGAHPGWGAYRLLVLADAAAARGDRDGARRLLAQLPEPGRGRALDRLRTSNRPAAAIAAEVLDGVSLPYR